MEDWIKKKKQSNRRMVAKDESVPTLFRIVPMYWASSGRTGTLQCFVWIHSCISVFPKLFNCWRAMRHEYSEFNVKNNFHFSPPTIESFILFLVNDTPHYAALYDLLCTEEYPRVLADSHNTMLFFLLHFLLPWNPKAPVWNHKSHINSSWGYKRFATFEHYLINVYWKKLLERVAFLFETCFIMTDLMEK